MKSTNNDQKNSESTVDNKIDTESNSENLASSDTDDKDIKEDIAASQVSPDECVFISISTEEGAIGASTTKIVPQGGRYWHTVITKDNNEPLNLDHKSPMHTAENSRDNMITDWIKMKFGLQKKDAVALVTKLREGFSEKRNEMDILQSPKTEKPKKEHVTDEIVTHELEEEIKDGEITVSVLCKDSIDKDHKVSLTTTYNASSFRWQTFISVDGRQLILQDHSKPIIQLEKARNDRFVEHLCNEFSNLKPKYARKIITDLITIAIDKRKDDFIILKNACLKKELGDGYNPESKEDKLKLQGSYLPSDYRLGNGFLGSIQRGKTVKKDDIEYTVFEPITNCQVIVTGYHKNIDYGTDSIEITFAALNGEQQEWRSVLVPFEAINTIEGFKSHLIPKGLSVEQKNIPEVISYFNKCIKANIDIATSRDNLSEFKQDSIYSKPGWKDSDYTKYIGGSRTILDVDSSAVVVKSKFTNVGVDRKITPTGTTEKLFESIKPLIKYYGVRYLCYAAMSTILSKPLDSPHCIYVICSSTSTGKTTAIMVIACHIGNPHDNQISLLNSGNVSIPSIEAVIEQYCDLPTFFDEMEGTPDSIKKSLSYLIGNGKGRLRSKITGELRDEKDFHTTVFVSAEESMLPETGNDGGGVRTIEIRDRLIPEIDKQIIDRAKSGMYQNYGHILELFLDKFFQHKNELRGWYDASINRLMKLAINADERAKRQITYFARSEIAGILLEEIYSENGIDPMNPQEVVAQMFKMCVIQDQDTPMAIKALEFAYNLSVAWANNHMLDSDKIVEEVDTPDGWTICKPLQKGEIWGWNGITYIDFLKPELDAELKKAGYSNKKAIYDHWRKHGIIETEDEKNNTVREFHYSSVNAEEKTRMRVVRFKLVKVYELLGLDMPTPIQQIVADIDVKKQVNVGLKKGLENMLNDKKIANLTEW